MVCGVGVMYRVMIVDDYEPYLQLVSHVLGQDKDFEVVATASSGEEALRLADQVCPGLVLMDVELGDGMSGIEATRRILECHPNVKVVVLSMYHGTEYARLATQVGALAFIPKQDFSLERLTEVLRHSQGN